jgi:outer membrane protein insertion porin family
MTQVILRRLNKFFNPAIVLIIVLVSLNFSINKAHSYGKLGRIVEYFVIDDIQVVGIKKVEKEAILEKIRIKKGLILDNYTLKKDIQSIYEMKFFETVEGHHKKVKGKNVLVFKVKEKPIINSINVYGNDEIDDDEVKEQLKSKPFSILDITTIKQDILSIQKLYEEKGFYLATVDYTLAAKGKDGVSLNLRVLEQDKVKVKKVTFLGNKNLSDTQLKGFMQTNEETLFSFMSGSGSFKEFNFKGDIERLKYLYKTRGFLQVNIGNPTITVSEDKKWIFITVHVNEGPKFSINEILYNGELLFTEEELGAKVSLKPGNTYSEEKLRKDIQSLTELYQDKGYAFANVLRNLEIVPGENKVNINFSFEKGKIAYFGDIIIKGNTKTRDKVIRRELKVYEGMKYAGSKLRISKENVNRLGFFEQGSVIFNTVSPKGKDDVLNVEISVKERQTGQISLGAGYSTATKGFLQASVQQNNFRGLGQNLNFSFSMSDKQQVYNLGFTEPYFKDTKWTAGGDIFKTASSFISAYTMEKKGFDLRVGYPIYDYTRLFLTYKLEDIEVSSIDAQTLYTEDTEAGLASGLELSIRYDKRNNAFEPTNGFYGRGALEYVGLGGDLKWIKAELEGRMFKPVVGELIFRSRLKIQQVMEVGNTYAPRHSKFSMGGARNMRGFSFEDIGPHEEALNSTTNLIQDYNIGGRFSILSNFELEHPLIKEAGLKWVVFFDAGNVFENYLGESKKFEDKANYNLKANYGFGFRWFSPIGVLRFEFAYPVSGEDDHQFHFDIGPFF